MKTRKKLRSISRSADGTVKNESGEVLCKLPSDSSIFSLFGPIRFVPNGDYSVDPDWIYVGGKPTRKQLQRITSIEHGGETHVWGPKLKDINTLEKKHHRVSEARNKYFKEIWQKTIKEIDAVGGKAHCRVLHKYDGLGDPWWLWTVSDHGISFDWVNTPKKPINLDLGDKFYHAEKRMETLSRRLYKYRISLEKALTMVLDEKTGSRLGYFDGTYPPKNIKMDAQVIIDLNGRCYWYELTTNKNGVWMWKLLSWPDDKPIVIKL